MTATRVLATPDEFEREPTPALDAAADFEILEGRGFREMRRELHDFTRERLWATEDFEVRVYVVDHYLAQARWYWVETFDDGLLEPLLALLQPLLSPRPFEQIRDEASAFEGHPERLILLAHAAPREEDEATLALFAQAFKSVPRVRRYAAIAAHDLGWPGLLSTLIPIHEAEPPGEVRAHLSRAVERCSSEAARAMEEGDYGRDALDDLLDGFLDD